MFVVGRVLPRPAQVRYQRIVAFAGVGNVIVVTSAPLPPELLTVIQEVHYADSGGWRLVHLAYRIASRLRREGRTFAVHTQYSLAPLLAGYLCRRAGLGYWVYDLWDHPSLIWSGSGHGVLKRFLAWLAWVTVVRRLLRRADVWIVGMHPGILGHMPPAASSCRILLTGPGHLSDRSAQTTPNGEPGPHVVRIVYTGSISVERGIELIAKWIGSYVGPEAVIEIIGPCVDRRAERVLEQLRRRGERDGALHVRVRGELPFQQVETILQSADIGLSPLDERVVNYRFAFPVKVVQYMSRGLIVVASASDGAHELIDHGHNGFLSPKGLSAWGRTMDLAISACMDDTRRKAFSEGARRAARERTWPRVNADLMRRLSQMLQIKDEG